MDTPDQDRSFAGSIPQLYDQYLVPLIFEPYAVDLARRVTLHAPANVLEIAAGTGVLTRHLAQTLSPDATLVATDLNQPMLDHAAAVGMARAVSWRQADALALPFPDLSFDVIVCQFGVMFFPDKPRAFAEARRVLRPGGHLIFNVWDRIEYNAFAENVTQALAMVFPNDPPRFLARVPHGYHVPSAIAADLQAGGFDREALLTTLAVRSRAATPHLVAVAYCQGTPLRNEIEARGVARLDEVTARVAAVLEHRFGAGPVEGTIQAHIITITR